MTSNDGSGGGDDGGKHQDGLLLDCLETILEPLVEP